MRRLLFLVVAALSLVLSLSAATATSADRAWTITDLSIDAEWSSASAINNSGVVVGDSSRGGFVWRNGVTTYLGEGYWLNDINDRGQAVGLRATDETGETFEAFVWQDGVRTDLGTLEGGEYSAALGINDRGQVVGVSSTAGWGATRAFLWEDGEMTDLGTLGASYDCATALDINNRGQVVGYSWPASGPSQRGFLWEDGVMTDLGTLGGAASWPQAISNNGQVVGSSPTESHNGHAFLWNRGAMVDLTPDAGSDIYWTAGFDVNNRGQITGATSGSFGTHALLWEQATVTDLGSLGGPSSYPNAINDRGQVAGWSTTPDGDQHAVLFSQK